MSFLSPWMLMGLLGALVPIAIHLQGRQKAKVVPFAALDFLIGTDKRVAKRLVLRQILQLVTRVLICVVIALILSKPYGSCSSPGPVVSRGPQAVVIIIDNSGAAGYRLKGRTLLKSSIASAIDLVKRLGPEAEIALLTTTDGQGELTRDHMALRAQLRATNLTSERADTARALHRAQQLLSGSNHSQKSIYIFGAKTRSLLPESLSFGIEGVSITVLDPAQGHFLANTAITDVQVSADNSIGNRGATISAEVANYGETTIKQTLRLQVGEQVVARGEVEVVAGQRKQKKFSVNLSDQPRLAEVSVHLEPDGLSADDVRYLVADARDQVAVLLINGDPHTVRHEDELYYLEAALRPGDQSESGTTLTVCTADTLADVDINSFDVAVLANVRSLPDSLVTRLSGWVKAGGGLLVAVGDQVDADSYNQNMAPLLAQSLRSRLDLLAGRKTGPGGKLHLSKLESDHPIFSIFSTDAPGLYNASFSQIMLLGPTTEVRERRVLARYDNGAAALVEARKGAGQLLLFTSTLDRDWNDLAIHPGYLPLMQQSVRYLAAKPLQDQSQQVIIGESLALKITGEDSRIEVRGPDAVRMVLEGEKLRGRSTARLDHISVPGIYRVESVDLEGRVQERPDASFAANLDPAISDLRPVPSDGLRSLAAGTMDESSKGGRKRRVELWHAISAGLLFLLLVEALLSYYTGRSKRLVRARP